MTPRRPMHIPPLAAVSPREARSKSPDPHCAQEGALQRPARSRGEPKSSRRRGPSMPPRLDTDEADRVATPMCSMSPQAKSILDQLEREKAEWDAKSLDLDLTGTSELSTCASTRVSDAVPCQAKSILEGIEEERLLWEEKLKSLVEVSAEQTLSMRLTPNHRVGRLPPHVVGEDPEPDAAGPDTQPDQEELGQELFGELGPSLIATALAQREEAEEEQLTQASLSSPEDSLDAQCWAARPRWCEDAQKWAAGRLRRKGRALRSRATTPSGSVCGTSLPL